MRAGLSPAGGRRLAIAMAVLPLLLLLAAGFWAYRYIGWQERETARLATEISQLRQGLKSRERVMTELSLLERSSDHEALLVQSPTPALAGAALQGLITRLVAEADGVIDIVQVLEPKESEPFVEIAIRVEAEVSMPGLRELLHAIETREPLLAIDKLAVAPLYADLERQGAWVDFKADISAYTWGRRTVE